MLVGVLFTIIGIVGFAAINLDGFASHQTPDQLFGMAVNPLQNLVHLSIGAAGIVLSSRLFRARVFGWVLVIGLGALFGYGVLVARMPEVDVLNLNWVTNWLHLTFALIGLVVAVGPVPARRTEPTMADPESRTRSS